MPSVTIRCPHCRRTLDVSDELLGRQVRCQECRGVFVAKRAGASDEAEKPRPKPRPRRPRVVDEPCPYCGEDAPLDARACPHCGLDLEDEFEVDERPWEEPGEVRRDVEPHRGGVVLALGIVGLLLASPTFCCPVFAIAGLSASVPAWVMGRRDLARMRLGELDPEGRGTTQSGIVCGIIGVAVVLLGLVVQGGIVLLSFMK
jgi:hypothetical protein